MTKEQRNEEAAQQVASQLIRSGLLGVKTQGDVVSLVRWNGDVVLLKVSALGFEERA